MSVEAAKARLAAKADESPENVAKAEALRTFLLIEQELEHRFTQGAISVYGWPKEKILWDKFGHPNPVQQKFHSSKALVRVLLGGNRSGKSQAGCSEDVAHARGVREWLPKDHPDYYVKVRIPNKGVAMGESFNEQVKKVFIFKLLGDEETGQGGLLPVEDVVDKKKNNLGVIGRIKVRVHPDAARRAGIRFNRPEELPVSTIDFMCLRGDQRVQRADGTWVPISQLEEGDVLAHHEGGTTKVVRTFSYPPAPMFRIRTRHGHEIIATANHKHFVCLGLGREENGSDIALRRTDELNEGDQLLVSTYSVDGPDEKMPEWLLGWTAIGIGDGCLRRNDFGFTAIGESRVLNNLPPLPPDCRMVKMPSSKGEYRIWTTRGRRDNPLVLALKEFGLWGCKSGEKFVPAEVFRQPDSAKAYFLRHLWNCDGSIRPRRQAQYTTISRQLAYDVKYLLWSLGIRASITEAHGTCGFTGKPTSPFLVTVSGGSFDRFMLMLEGGNFAPIPTTTRGNEGQITYIERVEDDIPYCVEVDAPDHAFIVDGLVTHNSYEQEAKLFESHDYDWAHFDEPPPRKIFIAVKRGLTDRLGPCWFTATPLKEAWVKREIIAKAGVDSFVMDIQDNVGYGLTQEQVDEFASFLDEDEREMRLRGKFFHLVGAVYKALGDIHKVPRSYLPRKVPATWGIWHHADTHDRVPHHAVWMFAKPDATYGVIYIVAGAMKNADPQNRLRPFSEAVREYELGVLGISADDEVNRLIDPLADAPNPADDQGRSFMDFLHEYGLHYRKGSKKRADAIKITKEVLGYDLRAIPPQYPQLYIVDDLKEVWDQMEEYRWMDFTGPAADQNNPREQPVKKDDHYVEGIHRCLLDRPQPRGIEGDEEEYDLPAASSSRGGFARGY